ncbi:MAG: ketoacyl-ACP synthase III [Desulfovibrio sp.]|uniref:3-oxoacyl-ACP synthase III family protein n=1 Tax=Desulfovibrio sp. TaxID=885 RepID=UPI001A72AD9A|nr:ketoacyl-ACP synthase III [Desulfovibrio sp.]MBD5417265.1 ketoacyl-ACP synthase III [Desulfovibrio sp.]
MFHELHHIRIAGLRAAVPANEIRLEDEAAYYGGSLKKVARMRATLGMDRRRVCPPDVTASDLCAHAARALLNDMPGVIDNIDALVFVSQSPDWKQPATACELQHRLGLPTSCATFDVNQGCSGYVYGLWIASSLVGAGAARQALLLVGDAHAGGRDPRNRVMAPVFGDGGSATLLVRDETAPPLQFGFGTNGQEFETIITPGGQARIPLLRDAAANAVLAEDILDPMGNPWQLGDAWMDGGAVFNFTMDVVPPHIEAALHHASLSTDDIAMLILHQANTQIVRTIAEKAGFPPEKAPGDSFSRYGNLAAASIPAALCDAFGHVASPGKILMCGYGIGLAWGSCLCDLEHWNCSPTLDFTPDPDRPTRAARVERWQKILRGEISRHDS